MSSYRHGHTKIEALTDDAVLCEDCEVRGDGWALLAGD